VRPKPTLEELEAILNGPECLVTVNPDGSIDSVDRNDVLKLRAERDDLVTAMKSVRAECRYARKVYGDLASSGWDRVERASDAALKRSKEGK